MIQFQEIQIDDVYLTSDNTAAGYNYLTSVTGLAGLKLTNSRISGGEATDGTPLIQFRSHKGKPIEITINLLPTAKYTALVNAINAKEAADENHEVIFTGDKGTFSLTCVLDSLDDSGEMISAGHRDVVLNFRIATVVSIS